MIFVYLIFFFINLTKPVSATSLLSSAKIKVSASIPNTTITLFGYTAPKTKVELSNPLISAVTISQENGYFEFSQIDIPKTTQDLCLSSIDDSTRPTPIVCIPPPPTTQFHTSIGPIILAPTLSLSDSSISANQTIIISGQAIPNADVTINFFQQNQNPSLIPLVKSVHAFALPQLSTTSDSEGNFSINLPTVYATNYRIYATALFDQLYPSPKSITLKAILPSIWSIYRLYIIMIPLFIFTLSIFIYLTIVYYHTNPPRYLPALYQKSLILK